MTVRSVCAGDKLEGERRGRVGGIAGDERMTTRAPDSKVRDVNANEIGYFARIVAESSDLRRPVTSFVASGQGHPSSKPLLCIDGRTETSTSIIVVRVASCRGREVSFERGLRCF